jgi:hypothetical protein
MAVQINPGSMSQTLPAIRAVGLLHLVGRCPVASILNPLGS